MTRRVSSEKMGNMNVKRRDLTELELSQVKESWDLANPSGKQAIDAVELRIALKCLNFEPPKDEIRQMTLDKSSDPENPKFKRITYNEFVEIVTKYVNSRDQKSEIIKAFTIFDEDQTGKISFKNLRTVTDGLGLTFTDKDLREMIEEADFDNDGEVSVDEFFQIMKKTNLF